ncbi:hypothetical protein F4803DRAFT_47018 [Xylaria telfairii]|nr:hypothetical protein F4803DRAFT_47018 [Xylaria telfairii]
MPKKSICAILRMGRRKKVEDGSKNSQNSTAQPALVAGPSAQGSKLLDPDPPINDQGQPPTAPTNVAPRPSANAADFEALPLPIPDAQPAPDHVQIARKHRAQEALPKPYASSAEMWNESQKSLSDVEKHNIEKLKGKQCKSADQDDIKAVRDQMMAGFNTRSQDDRVGYVIEKAVTILGKLLSIGDVLVSIDPLHAAPPWAFVRSVLVLLSSNSELKSRLIAGIAMVASLLAQCETYQQLYMAPDLPLRPPKESLLELKTFIVQTYAKSQQFLSFAILQQQQSTVAAPFNLGGAEDHANDLAKCEKKLIRAAEDCERHCNLSDRQNMKELLNLQADFSRAFQDQIDLILNRIDNKERIEMLEWISPIQYGRHHDRVKEDRTVDTCKWLLEHYKFREWEESSLSTILWLQGSPGAGKTFLASKVIDHELARLKSSPNQEGFAFFYCDRNEEERRKPLSVLQSYVRQLSTTARKPGCIRRQLQDFCLNARESGSDLGFSDCREQMLQSINLYSQTTLVLDALDECEPESRLKILKVIEDLLSRSESRLKIFISSRPDRDIRDRFLETPNIEIQATDNEEDIRKFVRKKITEHGHWPKMSQDLQDYIAEVLFIKSTGMFQWAFLQINELLSLETESAIRSRLGKLPTNLKTAYDEIYGKITALDEHDRALADRAFKWVACSQEPLNSEGLLSAIRLDSHTTTYNLSVTITESQLLHLCHNLLVIDTQRDVWRFSHLSVTEYFEEHHWDLRRAHSHAASVCIKFLIEAYKTVDSKKGLDVLPRINLQLSLPFGNYAHRHWIFHTRAQEGEGVDPILAQLLKSFLDSPQKTSVQYRKWFNTISRDINTYEGRDYLLKKDLKCLKDTSVALFVMCHFSFYYILQDWWERAEFDISVTNDEGYNLLILATRAGSKQICENLITRKIEVNLQLYNGEYGSALAAAVIEGQIEIVKLLVNEAGADVDMQLEYGSYGSALVAASLEGQIETVKFLVEAGANVHMQLKNGAFGSALAAAASGGKIEIVKFLINEAGANVHMQLENGGYGSRPCSSSLCKQFAHSQVLD